MPKSTSSWYWRQVCSLKDKLKEYYTKAQIQQISHLSLRSTINSLVIMRSFSGVLLSGEEWEYQNTNSVVGWLSKADYRLEINYMAGG